MTACCEWQIPREIRKPGHLDTIRPSGYTPLLLSPTGFSARCTLTSHLSATRRASRANDQLFAPGCALMLLHLMADVIPISVPFESPDADTSETPLCDRMLQRRLRNSQMMAAVLLIPGLPIIGLCALLVRLTSRGNPIYRQERVGLRGEVFTLYKIRSMTLNAEAGTGPVWAQKGDPRVTLIGRFLRFTHLDELPQLFNILRGEMCINGPRPERPEFVEELARQIPRYTERLQVHPGVTGLAQVRAPADSDLQTVRNKLSLDLAYIRSLGRERAFDFRILCATVLKMVGLPQKLAAKVFGLLSVAPVEIPSAVPATEMPRREAA